MLAMSAGSRARICPAVPAILRVTSCRCGAAASPDRTRSAGSKPADGVHRNLAAEFGHRAGDIVQEPTTMPWGNRSLLVRDPDGSLVNFFTPVTPAAIAKFAR
jgi:hypothetical protein